MGGGYLKGGYSFFIGSCGGFEMSLVQTTLLQISELRGAHPTIALPANMVAELGEDAMFVTLPIGRVGARSRNGRTYTREAVQAIVDAVNKNKPEGRWGHLRDEDRPYEYAPPAMRWLAAMIDGEGVAWAKGIPVTAEAREHFRLAKIAGSRVGTSVYGFGRMDGDNVVAFELESIDLAAPDRVGIPETAAEPIITKETEDNTMPDQIHLEDVPESIKKQILEQYDAQQSGARLTEMEAENKTLKEQVSTVTAERDAARGEASTLLATYVKAKIAEAVKLEPVQKLVSKLVGIKETDDGKLSIDGVSTVAEADKALETVLADEDLEAFNKESVKEMMGPDFVQPANRKDKGEPVLGSPLPS